MSAPTGPRTCQMPKNGGLCGKKAKARWLCASDYSTWVTRGRPELDGLAGKRMAPEIAREYAPARSCTVPGCTTKARGHGLCSKHLKRQQRNGAPTTRIQTCAHDGHQWRTDGPGRPSPYCPEHRP